MAIFIGRKRYISAKLFDFGAENLQMTNKQTHGQTEPITYYFLINYYVLIFGKVK